MNETATSPVVAQAGMSDSLSIVIPTFREAENIPLILDRIDKLRQKYNLTLEVLFMDDDSQDGSIEAVDRSGFNWARIIVRTENRGLSPAVLDGLHVAKNSILICMDCDLSHPPEAIPEMVQALNSGKQFAIGSRYIAGGSTDDDWGAFRWLNSLVATLLARPLTSARDPLSGFFAIRKRDFEAANALNPIGYKIGLELIVKCGIDDVGEIPIHFQDRVHGDSKLSLKEQLKYVQHLRRLYIYKFGDAMHLLQFMTVGASGVIVNLSVLTILVLIGLPEAIALGGGIGVSLLTNFLLNRRFSFSYARHENVWKQLFGFAGASATGALVNYGVAIYLRITVLPDTFYALHIAALVGITCGTAFNFIGNRYFVFKKRHVGR